jgi:hypothetical protein
MLEVASEIETCIACETPLREGDLVLHDAEGGLIHRGCCGEDRDGYVGADGNPLGDGEPIPAGWPWSPSKFTEARK